MKSSNIKIIHVNGHDDVDKDAEGDEMRSQQLLGSLSKYLASTRSFGRGLVALFIALKRLKSKNRLPFRTFRTFYCTETCEK